MQGHTRREMDNLREDVIKCLALLEALIDFGEGEDLEEGVYDQGSPPSDKNFALVYSMFRCSCRKGSGPDLHHRVAPRRCSKR